MSKSYFADLKNKSNGRFWINNPSEDDVKNSLEQGAVNCTTNPAYCSKLIQSDKEYLHSVIDKVLIDCPDIDEAAVLTSQQVTRRLLEMFRLLYEKTGGREGYVTIQDDPRNDSDAELTIKSVYDNRKLGENYMAKIPVINGGIEAIEECVKNNIPVCATEVFSISQAVHICGKYDALTRTMDKKPPFYITHITGIFDEYLEKTVKREGIDVSPEALELAGLAVARKEYRVLKEKGFDVTMLGGGARRMEHFTGIMGGDAHVTINWSTAEEILGSKTEYENNIELTTDQGIISELLEKIPDFAKAYNENGLSVDEFTDYGPVQLFRNSFLKGWHLLLAEIAGRKVVKAI